MPPRPTAENCIGSPTRAMRQPRVSARAASRSSRSVGTMAASSTMMVAPDGEVVAVVGWAAPGVFGEELVDRVGHRHRSPQRARRRRSRRGRHRTPPGPRREGARPPGPGRWSCRCRPGRPPAPGRRARRPRRRSRPGGPSTRTRCGPRRAAERTGRVGGAAFAPTPAAESSWARIVGGGEGPVGDRLGDRPAITAQERTVGDRAGEVDAVLARWRDR